MGPMIDQGGVSVKPESATEQLKDEITRGTVSKKTAAAAFEENPSYSAIEFYDVPGLDRLNASILQAITDGIGMAAKTPEVAQAVETLLIKAHTTFLDAIATGIRDNAVKMASLVSLLKPNVIAAAGRKTLDGLISIISEIGTSLTKASAELGVAILDQLKRAMSGIRAKSVSQAYNNFGGYGTGTSKEVIDNVYNKAVGEWLKGINKNIQNASMRELYIEGLNNLTANYNIIADSRGWARKPINPINPSIEQ